jgi:hypothetical protein
MKELKKQEEQKMKKKQKNKLKETPSLTDKDAYDRFAPNALNSDWEEFKPYKKLINKIWKNIKWLPKLKKNK